VAALGANLLSLKPCIEVKNGAMGVGKKYRGNLGKCLLQYVKDRLDGRDDIDTRRIFITESGGYTDEEVEQVRQTVLACQPFAEVLHTNAGCTVSSHCGPKTLGILYFHK
jgi:fatty acid-binding protein DegV